MIRLITEVYGRLDRAQRGFWFKVVASLLALALCGWIFGRLVMVSNSLQQQRMALAQVLFDETLNREAALGFKSTGLIRSGMQEWGGEEWIQRAPLYVDARTGLILSPVTLIEQLLMAQRPAWAPSFMLDQPRTTWMIAVVGTLWLLLIIWMSLTVQFLLTLLATLAAVALPWWRGSEQWVLALGGIGLLSFTFMLLMRAMLMLMEMIRWQPMAVAQAVIREASRLNITLVFIVFLLVMLPLIPMRLDPTTPLRYRLQTFISNSLTLTTLVASVMTIFLACATVSFEIRDRQIWQLLTKPLARFNYLLGKWLGVVAINVVILCICGLSIFVYVQYLRHLPVASGAEGQMDRMAINEEILTARVGTRPLFEPMKDEDLRKTIDQMIQNDPQLAELEAKGQLDYGRRAKLAKDILDEHLLRQRTISSNDVKTYVFRNLKAARDTSTALSLRFRFFIGRSDEHDTYTVGIRINEDPATEQFITYVPTITRTYLIGSNLIRDDGTISITIANMPKPGREPEALHFELKDFELLYRAGDFEGNFFRAMVTSWIKLAFLAMLGVTSATFLSFPVACLVSFSIFLAGSMGPYLAYALEEYYPTPWMMVDKGDVGMVIGWAFETVIRALAQGILFILGSFGAFSPTTDLVEGRLIPWWGPETRPGVGQLALRIGVLWTSLALGVGYLVFRRRELAIYSGQG